MTETIKVPHTINLVTEFDPTHPMVQRIMQLPEPVLSKLLVDTFISVVETEGFLDKINDNNKYATVKFADSIS